MIGPFGVGFVMRHRLHWIVVAAVVAMSPDMGLAKPKKHKDGKAHTVARFETPFTEETIEPGHADVALVEGGKKRKGKALRVVTEKDARWSRVRLFTLPADLRPMRTLRFWLRGDGHPEHELYVRLYDEHREMLEHVIDTPSSKWHEVRIRIAHMRADSAFEPTKLKMLAFVWFDPKTKHEIHLDDIELLEGEGGWRMSEKEMAAHVFGEKRMRKVKKKQTKHFTVWMDTKAAAKKFPKALESAYGRVKKWLALDEMERRLPVYMFQNPNGYWDFCQRHLGWSKESAQDSAGHGSSRYFATYFQGNKTPTVTHELTHSMVSRTVGWGGGSWFQEGSAVYCEELDQGRSAARLFSPNVRGERFLPLRKFIALERLIDSKDKRGGAETSHNLYAQAGAVFEFLLRSASVREKHEIPKARDGQPYFGGRLRQLAKLREEGDELVAAVEKIYGMSVEELEKAWVAWGSKPPKPDK